MNLKREPEHGPVYFELNTGAKIPSVGLGTWKAELGLVGDAVIAAVKAGYIHIDCARVCGNEKEARKYPAVSAALKQLIFTEVVRRSDLWITSKLCDHAPVDVAKALKKTLEDLQLDYIDLYLTRTKPGSNRFEPESVLPLCFPETWNAMEGLYASGQAHAISVSNFATKKLQDLLKCARCHPQSTRLSVIESGSSPGSITSASQPARLMRGAFAVNETESPYKSVNNFGTGIYDWNLYQ